MERPDGSVGGDDQPDERTGAFADDLPVAFDLDQLDLRRVADPLVLRPVLAVAVAAFVVLWPAPTDRVLIAIAGFGLAGLGVTTAWNRLRRRNEAPIPVGVALVMTVAGVVVALSPGLSIEIAGRALAVVVGIGALVELVDSWRLRHELGIAWPLAKAVALLFVAVLVYLSPGSLLAVAVSIVSVGVAGLGVLAVMRSARVDTPTATDVSMLGTARDVVDWLAARRLTPTERSNLLTSLFYEGADAGASLGRFFVLMTLSAVIAAGGVLTDSTATVIGAMLVAPLMTPLMAIAVSVVMGWPNRLGRAAVVVTAAVGVVVLVGLMFGAVAPVTLDPTTNTQILGRSEPAIANLVVAIAAGAAGAYSLARPGLSGALPGVAIAISLVPPLSVAGITFATGAAEEGVGALLLFSSNALAIIIVGGLTFVITGLTPLGSLRPNQQRVRTASAAIVTFAVFVVAALALNGRELAANAIETGRAGAAVQRWLAGTEVDYSVLSVDVEGDTVVVTIVGPPGRAPSSEALQQEMADTLGRPVSVELQTRLQTVRVIDPP